MMRAPMQAPPVPRLFMRLVVGRDWDPHFEKMAIPRRGKSAKPPPNPCLVQLTTFALRRRKGR